MLDLIEKSKTRDSSTDEGDHDKFAHYVNKNDHMRAILDGTPITALCGKKWVPTRAPDSFAPCPDCQKVWELIPE